MESNFSPLHTGGLERGLKEKLRSIIDELRGEMYLGGVVFDRFQPQWTLPASPEGFGRLPNRDGVAILFQNQIPFALLSGGSAPFIDLHIAERQSLNSEERSRLFARINEVFALRAYPVAKVPEGFDVFLITRIPEPRAGTELEEGILPAVSENASRSRADHSRGLLLKLAARYRDFALDPSLLHRENLIADTSGLLLNTLQAFGAFVLHDCRRGVFRDALEDALFVRHSLDKVRSTFSLLKTVQLGPDIDCTPILAADLRNDVGTLVDLVDRLFDRIASIPVE